MKPLFFFLTRDFSFPLLSRRNPVVLFFSFSEGGKRWLPSFPADRRRSSAAPSDRPPPLLLQSSILLIFPLFFDKRPPDREVVERLPLLPHVLPSPLAGTPFFFPPGSALFRRGARTNESSSSCPYSHSVSPDCFHASLFTDSSVILNLFRVLLSPFLTLF